MFVKLAKNGRESLTFNWLNTKEEDEDQVAVVDFALLLCINFHGELETSYSKPLSERTIDEGITVAIGGVVDAVITPIVLCD